MLRLCIQLLELSDTVIVLGDVNYNAIKTVSTMCKQVISIPVTHRCYADNIKLNRERNIFMLNNYLIGEDITSSSKEIFNYRYKCLIVTSQDVLDKLIINHARHFPLIILADKIDKFYFPRVDVNIDGLYKYKGDEIILVNEEAIYNDDSSHRIRLYIYNFLYVINVNLYEVGVYYNNTITWYNGNVWYK